MALQYGFSHSIMRGAVHLSRALRTKNLLDLISSGSAFQFASDIASALTALPSASIKGGFITAGDGPKAFVYLLRYLHLPLNGNLRKR
jgi:hypothetical protein